jgi:thiol-disulfide isomerase/thioredoxin
MTEIIIVLSALLIVLVLIRHYGAMQEGFTDYSSGGKERSVVICKADWCGHCKKAAPEFQKLVAASPITLKDGSKVTVKVLDADKDKSEIAKYKPRGFPTILIVDGGNTTEYPGDRTYSGVIDFLNSNY